MPNILMLHGVNLNLLGIRNKDKYGCMTLLQLEELVKNEAAKYGYNVLTYQSNHEGDLIDKIQTISFQCQGIIINAGAFTHYSYGLHDALVDTNLPIVEVHLSNLMRREAWRQNSVIRPACIEVIMGKKEQGYIDAVTVMMGYLSKCN